ncbi:Alanine--tRNA ligase [Astathelohania contejeani]|uniref:Alanine--tRNA ligase n=1 Tax=Astathelohania contejeani TaxID=164912 RepID=A0ABQ7HW44_9MICR|nr:Alanine--tRNA ligase [Thelohania contejeani]
MKSDELEKTFIDYFKKLGHTEIASSSVIPYNDSTLIFANSGMVQFKPIFLDELDPMSPWANMRRACSIQNCIRAGGKHNDLDDVGKDTYHHTFFRMLGNWSFGDYFKEEAIFYAWDFLTNKLNLSPLRLYATYYKTDSETKNIWLKYLPENRVLPFGEKDNFWEMGDTGPCGPCTEIHYDRIGNRDASAYVNKDDPNVIEIWNIVFMEYKRGSNGLTILKKKCIDTGMGFERVLSILNDVKSNYLTDAFLPIFKTIEEMGIKPYTDTLNDKIDIAYRVIADHARTIAVCLSNGVTFSNVGRGYILRRIIRRAIRYYHEVLKLKKDFEKVIKIAADTLKIDLSISQIELISIEELQFLKTLDNGTNLLNKIIKECIAKKENVIPGRIVFQLYDTFGFPPDLTQIMAEEKGLKIDMAAFENEKNNSRLKNRKSMSNKELIDNDEIVDKFSETDDKFKYEKNGILCEVLYISSNYVVTNKTCFYSESGGQVGDKGKIEFYKNGKKVGIFRVDDTKKIRRRVLHIGELIEGNTSGNCKLIYDEEWRQGCKRSHTATHLLNYTLKRVLGDNIEQKGSLVEPGRLRFDFSYNGKLSVDEIKSIEILVNEMIKEELAVNVNLIEFKKIKNIPNIIYLKDEIYPEYVRVVNINDKSIELCGGTHLSNTKEIKLFKIVAESGIAASIRRIIARVGDVDDEVSLFEKLQLQEKKDKEISENLIMKKKMYKENLNELKEVMNKENNFIIFKYKIDSSLDIKLKHLIKDINLLGTELNKKNGKGIIYFTCDNIIYFTIRHDNALAISEIIGSKILNVSWGGNDKCVNGQGEFEKEENVVKIFKSVFLLNFK